METRKIVLHETSIIAIGECIGVAGMFLIFALLGKFDRTVLLGGIIGALLAILNFFLMAVHANNAADRALNQSAKGGQFMQLSYAARLVAIFIILFAGVKSGLCNVFAIVIPLVFVRPTIMISEFFRKSGE